MHPLGRSWQTNRLGGWPVEPSAQSAPCLPGQYGSLLPEPPSTEGLPPLNGAQLPQDRLGGGHQGMHGPDLSNAHIDYDHPPWASLSHSPDRCGLLGLAFSLHNKIMLGRGRISCGTMAVRADRQSRYRKLPRFHQPVLRQDNAAIQRVAHRLALTLTW